MSEASNLDYPRRVVIDDTHSRIRYSSGSDWTLDNGGFDDKGMNGMPTNHTMHGTNKAGASFEFAFEGDYILVRGGLDPRNTEAKSTPTWTCSLDGSPIPAFPLRDGNRTTNNALCELGHISQRKHTLTVNVTDEEWFWLDALEYHPLVEKGIDGELLRIDSSDNSVLYNNATGAWVNLGSGYNATVTTGASLSMKFNGSSIAMYGFIEGSDQEWSESRAQYHIDTIISDQTFSVATSKKLATGERADFRNQLHFETQPFDASTPHELVVNFGGPVDSTKTPYQWLSIDYFVITAAGTNTVPPSESSKVPTSVIVGTVVGGVVLLGAIAIAVFFFLKRRKENDQLQQQGGWFDAGGLFGGGGGPVGPGGQNYGYAAVTPFAPLEEEQRLTPSTAYYNPPVAMKAQRNADIIASYSSSNSTPSTSSMSYPPEKRRYNAAPTTSSRPSVTPSESSSSSPAVNPFASSHSNIGSSSSRQSYYDPYSEPASPGTGPGVIHVRHEDSGVRLSQGNQMVEDLPPGYTRD